jgi:hypothetical protein
LLATEFREIEPPLLQGIRSSDEKFAAILWHNENVSSQK